MKYVIEVTAARLRNFKTDLYPVTCAELSYDAASKLLEDEPGLFSHKNANELGGVIDQWIKAKRDNYEPNV